MFERLTPLAALGLALAVGSASPTRADPVKIRIAWVVAPAALSPILFAPPGVAPHLGKSYSFDPINITASPQHITAIAAGEIEIAALNFASFPLAIQNAGLTDLRIICDELQDGHDGYYTTHYMVRNDSGITAPAGLKGKVIAVNGLGTGVDMAMRAEMLKSGLHFPGDYTIVEVPFPTMAAVLNDKKADLITAAVPFVYGPELEKNAHTLFTMKDALGGAELSFWVMRDSFIKAHRAAVVDLLEDTVRAYRWYYDPKNHAAVVDIVAKFTKRPAEQLDWVFTQKDNWRNTDGLVNLDELQHNEDTVYQLGFIKKPIKVADYADLSLVKEAAARIK
ncbi:MAG TPA: ABC transporter substrate-binding protein [Stellaceae bacterium]|nr:ABC transporter substrate-binding protein [Stellaceae bacterium]